MYEEMVIGFDAREMWLKTDQLYVVHEDWRQKFLLRRQVDKVLSTDTLVWPSVFALNETLDPPSQRAVTQDLWGNLQEVKSCIAKGDDLPLRPCWIVGVTKLVDSGWKQEMQAAGYPIEPPELDEGWSLIGYDVSDQVLLSGLSSCSYTPDEVQTLGERWGPHLNEYHLLTSQREAVQFTKLSDGRVPGHAPFFVFGLYLIRKFGENQE